MAEAKKKTITKKKTLPRGHFAVIETGGKQYKVAEGEVVKIEKLPGGYKEGGKIVFEKVLLFDNGKDTTVGDPYIKGAKVAGTLEQEGKNRKVTVIKYKAKSRYFVKKGHRQPFMRVKITSVK